MVKHSKTRFLYEVVLLLCTATSLALNARAADAFHANLSAPIRAFVCTKLLTGADLHPQKPIDGPVTPVHLIGVSSYFSPNGNVPSFTILSEEGGTFHDIPPHGILFSEEAIRKTLTETVFRNNPSGTFTVSENTILKNTPAWVRLRKPNGEFQSTAEKPMHGTYLFTLDWPAENHLLYAIRADEGQLLLYPPHKVLFSKEQPTAHSWPTDWKPQFTEWRLPKHARKVNLNDLSNLEVSDEDYRYTPPDSFPIGGTKIVPISQEVLHSPALKRRVWARVMPGEDFIEKHASGTLRKNSRYMAHGEHRGHERVAFEFGYGFENMPATRVELGQAISEGDIKALTEIGWHMEKLVHTWPFPEDKFQIAHIRVSDPGAPNGVTRSGIGILVHQTSYPYLPKHHFIFAILSEWDEKASVFKPVVNPF